MTNALIRLSDSAGQFSVAHHSGPGLRVIFWVQGCRLRCTRECLNPHLLTDSGGYLVAPNHLAQSLLATLAAYAEAEGVTVLGGEPFDQAAALAIPLNAVRQHGFSTVVYTGHVYEALRSLSDDGVDSLLRETDVLVDGPYVAEDYDPALVWRGSRNQRVLPLTDRYSEAELAAAQQRQGRAIFVSRGADGGIAVSGLQSRTAAADARRSAFQSPRRSTP